MILVRQMISLGLVLAMLCSLLPVGVYAEEIQEIQVEVVAPVVAIDEPVSGECGTGVNWELTTDGTLTISGSGAMNDYGASGIPWAIYSNEIINLVITDGVTAISSFAFDDCDALQNVSISNSVQVIGYSAFYDCDSLTHIILPDSVETLADSVFSFCDNLTTVELGNGISSIAFGVFAGCDALTNVTIPDSITSIGDSAFVNCSSLASITIPSNVSDIGTNSFGKCTGLKSIYFLGDAPMIEYNAFKDVVAFAYYPADNLSWTDERDDRKRDYEGSLTWFIGNGICGNNLVWEFEGTSGVLTISGTGEMCDYFDTNGGSPWNTQLTYINKVIIYDGVTSIGENAFDGCSNMTSITLPDSLLSIGEGAFSSCSSLSRIVVPRGVTEIAQYTFSGCYNLSEVILPSGIIKIGSGAFQQCNSLNNVSLPESVTYIGEHAFCHCYALKYLVIPEGLTWINKRTFEYCYNLSYIILPTTLETIAGFAFDGCHALNHVFYRGAKENAISTGLDDNVIFHYESDETDVSWVETCVDRGYFCTICNTFITKESSEQAIHVYNQEVPDEKYLKSEASCTSKSIYYKSCVCGEIGNETFEFGEALGHTEVIDKAVEATCTENGLTEGKHCSVCEKVLIAQEEISALNHDWDESTVTKEPTETETGIRIYTCENCEETKTEVIPVLEHKHSYTAVVTKPTCIEKGYTTYICSCGDNYTGDEVAKLGHTEVIDEAVEATCTETGLTEGKHCSVCEEVLTAQKEISALDHDWDEGTVTREPSAEKPGIRTFHCERCEETRTEEIPYEAPVVTGSVQRISGKDRVKTALSVARALKDSLNVDKFDAVIIATGVNEKFADALAGSYLANMKKAPILLYTNSGLSQLNVTFIQENLKANGTVYILGGTGAIPAAVEETLSAYNVVRLSGKTRYETNLEILKEAGVSGADEILIATGTNFADSLSASAVGLPLLLVNGKNTSLNAAQTEFLNSVSGKKITIIGGTGAVSEEMKETIEAVTGVTAERISGKTRHNTSVMIAQKYFPDADFALITYAKNFPDGLAGGPLAYAMGAPLLLTNAGQEAIANEYIAAEEIESGYVLGGDAAVSDETARKVFGLAADAAINKAYYTE